MKKNRNNIDDLFKKELGNYTETPPPAVWDALEKRLDSTPSAKPHTPFTWFGYFAMISVLILISVFVARSISGNSKLTKNIALNDNIAKEQKAVPGNTTNGNTITPVNNATTNNTTAIDNKLNAPDNKGQESTNAPGNKGQKATGSLNIDKQTNTTTLNKKVQNKTPYIANINKHNKYASAKNAAQNRSSQPNKTEPVTEQPQNVYNSSITNTETSADKTTDKDEIQEPAVPIKQNATDSSKKQNSIAANNKMLPQKAPKPKFNRFEAGIKGGYESGFDNDAAKKMVVSPYLQYNLSPKFSIMLQPAIKAADLSSRIIGGANSYYKANNDGTLTTQTDSSIVHVIGTNDSLWKWNYSYTQTHDSIVKTYVTGGTYVEFELPVLLKFYITKQFSVYGGVNIVYSKLTGITEQTYNSGPISITKTEIGYGKPNAPAPPPPEPLGITYTGTPYSNYTRPLYTAPQSGLLRFGYMLGFSYEFHKNWLFDALIQQSQVAPNVQAGYNVNTPVSAPYFRLTIGYKLIK